MTTELDCRGLACPAPVLQTKQVIEKENPVTIKVMVDNEAAKQNITRFLENQKFEVTIEIAGQDFHVIGKRSEATIPSECSPSLQSDTGKTKIMVMVTSDSLGHGDDTLGSKLLLNFLKTLKEIGEDLWRLVLVNNGVKLTIEAAEALPILKELAANRVTILVCGTCLNHFNLLEKKQVGETTNMLDIVTAMQIADKVINI